MRILLVEDESKVANFIQRGLVAETYAVDVAPDGRRALEFIAAYHYDLIVLDLMLPGIDGGEVLRRIRRVNNDIPVLILTAKDSLQEKVRHLDAGADDYLTKPFAFAEFLSRTKALLRRNSKNRAANLHISDLELDRTSSRVRRGGKRIELTAKEYALLEYMVVNAGRILSRDMIIEHVWDQSFDGATNIVDVYIRQLRNKIDEGHDFKLLRTVRGIGYTIADGSQQ